MKSAQNWNATPRIENSHLFGQMVAVSHALLLLEVRNQHVHMQS